MTEHANAESASRRNKSGSKTETGSSSGAMPTADELQELLTQVGAFVREGRRPHWLTEEAHGRITRAISALVDDVLDEDDELDDGVDIEGTLEQLKLLKEFVR